MTSFFLENNKNENIWSKMITSRNLRCIWHKLEPCHHPSVTCQGPILAPSKCQNYVSLENRNFLVDHEILSSSKLDQDQPFSIIKCSKEMETIKVFIIHIIKNHFSKLQNELFSSRKSIFRVLTCPLSLMTIINDFRKKNDSSHFQILNFQCLEIFFQS